MFRYVLLCVRSLPPSPYLSVPVETKGWGGYHRFHLDRSQPDFPGHESPSSGSDRPLGRHSSGELPIGRALSYRTSADPCFNRGRTADELSSFSLAVSSERPVPGKQNGKENRPSTKNLSPGLFISSFLEQKIYYAFAPSVRVHQVDDSPIPIYT